jgi:ATP-dependent Clp protease ATP-binding subunit ClpC
VFERFTEQARQVVVFAQDEAKALRHNYIGTEHLLLALLRDEDGYPARVLESFGVHGHAVRARVVEIVGDSDDAVTTGQIPFTPRAKRALELSLREALSLGANHIGPEHLLLGVLREREGVAARILDECGVDADQIRDRIGPPGPRWTSYAHGPRWPRRRRFRGLAIAREEALEEGNYDLARKLLELEIEDRQKRDEPKPDDG